jgi:hypothetical protein
MSSSDLLLELKRYRCIMHRSDKSERAQKLTGDNLKVVCAEFTTVRYGVFVMSVMTIQRQAHPHLQLQTWPRFGPLSLSLTMDNGTAHLSEILS